jgi:hypothetical protein
MPEPEEPRSLQSFRTSHLLRTVARTYQKPESATRAATATRRVLLFKLQARRKQKRRREAGPRREPAASRSQVDTSAGLLISDNERRAICFFCQLSGSRAVPRGPRENREFAVWPFRVREVGRCGRFRFTRGGMDHASPAHSRDCPARLAPAPGRRRAPASPRGGLTLTQGGPTILRLNRA